MKPSISAQVRQVIADTFGVDERELPADLSQSSLPDWTPSAHSVLLAVLEASFFVTFSMSEMLWMTSARRIADILRSKQAIGRLA